METSLELARCPDLAVARHNDARSEAVCGVALMVVVVAAFVMSLLPLSSVLCLVGFGASFAGLALVPWPKQSPVVFPEDIADPVLRETYRQIQLARGELEGALADAPVLAGVVGSIDERCRAAIGVCATIVPVANRVHRYLAANDEARIAREVAELRARAAGTADEVTARNLEHAAAAYERQLATGRELARTRDRIRARLDVVLASLRSFTATVVKLQTGEAEQLALAGESLSEYVDDVARELAALESVLELDAAA